MSRLLIPMLAFSLASGSALAQSGHLPNAAPLQSMQRAHSFSLVNQSNQTIVSATMRMTMMTSATSHGTSRCDRTRVVTSQFRPTTACRW